MGIPGPHIPFGRQACDVRVLRCWLFILPCQEDSIQK